jgi:hypothetical protein
MLGSGIDHRRRHRALRGGHVAAIDVDGEIVEIKKGHRA